MTGETRAGRYFRAIDAVLAADVPLSLKDIAEATGIPPSSAHRIVGILCEEGMLRRTPWRTYMEGPLLRRWLASRPAALPLTGRHPRVR